MALATTEEKDGVKKPVKKRDETRGEGLATNLSKPVVELWTLLQGIVTLVVFMYSMARRGLAVGREKNGPAGNRTPVIAHLEGSNHLTEVIQDVDRLIVAGSLALRLRFSHCHSLVKISVFYKSHSHADSTDTN